MTTLLERPAETGQASHVLDRHYPETYLLECDLESFAPSGAARPTPVQARVLDLLPPTGPDGFPWEQVLSGRAACRWESVERDLQLISARFPEARFTMTIRCARHPRHVWVQEYRAGAYFENAL